MRFAILATAVTGAMIWAMPAAGQQSPCRERSTMLDKLRESYQEAPVALGLMGDGNLLELAVSNTGSWTIVVTRPNKQTCAIAAGEKWVRVKHAPKNPHGFEDF
jgi:hypothetical protein